MPLAPPHHLRTGQRIGGRRGRLSRFVAAEAGFVAASLRPALALPNGAVYEEIGPC